MRSMFSMRLIRDHVLVMKYSYEYNENCFLILVNRIDWFLWLDVLDTIYDEEISHWRVSKSIYSRWLWIIAFMRFHEVDQFRSIFESFVQKASATVFVQEWYSYETNVNDLNWSLFKTVISWLEIWSEIVRIQQERYFSNWSSYCNQSRRTFCDSAWWLCQQCSSQKDYCDYCSLFDHWDFRYANLIENDKSFDCCFFRDQFKYIFARRNWRCQNVDDTM